MIFGIATLNAQYITPSTMNNGGGHGGNFEWSIGESASISFFNTNNLILTTGILQPLSNVVTGISNFGLSVFGNQITMGPNPTSNFLRIKAKMNQVGNLFIQLMDEKLSVLMVQEFGTFLSSYDKEISMQGYTDGVFYVSIYFKPMNGIPKMDIYKIIKISN